MWEPELLDAILQLFPLDTVEKPVSLMEVMPGRPDRKNTVWDTSRRSWKSMTTAEKSIGTIERFQFYEEAKQAYAILATKREGIVCQCDPAKRDVTE